MWLQGLLKDMGVKVLKPVTLYEDNQACIFLLEKWEHKRLKHVDIKYHFIKELVEEKQIKAIYIPTEIQKADILTKGIPGTRFIKLRGLLGLEPALCMD
jgi:hypothetical protein